MESETSHSLPSPSETPNAVDTETHDESMSRKQAGTTSVEKPLVAPKQQPKQQSIYWLHCDRGSRTLDNGTVQQIGICTEIPAGYVSTSGLKNHLEKRCKGSPLYEVSASEKNQAVLTNGTMRQGSVMVTHSFNKKWCELKVTEWVIIDEMYFRAVEGKGYKGMIHELQPRFRIPDRKKFAAVNAIQERSQIFSPASTLSMV